MAVPVYTNDLTTIATGDLNFDAGTWSESSDGGFDTAGSMVDDLNLQYVKTSINSGEALDSCTSQQYTKDGNGSGASGPGTIMYTHTAAFTVPADGVVLIDDLWAAPSALNIYAGTFGTAEAGVSVMIGDTAGDFDLHYVSGSDKPPAPEGGWTTYAVDPTLTPAGTIGTPTVLQTVGVAIAATSQARGNPHACQSVRYGRAEVTYTVGDAVTPATFTGYSLVDNDEADRFNLFKVIKGGFEARGLMTFGTAATAVYFEDSDKAIVIANDLKVGSAFNKGVVNNASSTLKWTNIAITNQSAVAKYTFAVNDSAITEHTGCVFTDLGVFSYGSNSTQDNVTYRRQDVVSQLGSTFLGCTFDSPLTTGLLADNLNVVNEATFSSAGIGHAVELTSIGTGSMTWDCVTSGYDAGTVASPVTPTATGDEDLYINFTSAADFTVNVAAEATTPSIRVGAGFTGNVNVVAGEVTLTISAAVSLIGAEIRIYDDDDTPVGSLGTELDGVESSLTATFPFTGTIGNTIYIQIMLPGYVEFLQSYAMPTASAGFTANLIVETN